MKIKEKSFRELNGQYIYLAARELAVQLEQFFADAKSATGVLVYCYLEHELGLQFEILCCACLDKDTHMLKLLAGNDKESVKLPYASISETDCAVLPQGLPRLAEFAEKVSAIKSACSVNADVAKTRTLTVLDHLRSAVCPDNVAVKLVHGEVVEECFVRLEGVNEMKLMGMLMSEPKENFGIHAGDRINFYLVKNTQGIMCLAMV